MAKQDIRDRTGHRIGWLDDRANEQVAFNSVGHRLGRYDKRNDTTYDSSGRRVGTGNQLAALIVADAG